MPGATFPHSSPDTTEARSATQEYTQDEVNYRPAGGSSTRCGNCAHYLGAGTCEIVSGNVSPDGVSDAYAPVSGTGLMDLVTG